MFERTLSVVLTLGGLPAAVEAQVRVGPEFQVNGVSPGNNSAVAADPSGRFLVVWSRPVECVSAPTTSTRRAPPLRMNLSAVASM